MKPLPPDGRQPPTPTRRGDAVRAKRSRHRMAVADPRLVGHDPDYRFTLANERTFLAWIRTALALAAGGLGAITLLDDLHGARLLGLGLLSLSSITAATTYRRWAHNERAIRLDEPLPRSRIPLLLAAAVAFIAVVGAVLVAIEAI